MLQVMWVLPEPEKGVEAQGYVLGGKICMRTEAGDFPCTGWKDAIVTNMISLIVTASRLLNPSVTRKKDVVVSFGPYYVAIEISEGGMATLHFLREYLPEALERLPPVTLAFAVYCQIILDSGQRLLEASRSEGVVTPLELGDLERHLNALKARMSTGSS